MGLKNGKSNPLRLFQGGMKWQIALRQELLSGRRRDLNINIQQKHELDKQI